MQPFILLPVHPALRPLVEFIVIMDFDFTASPLKSVYHYPWSAKTHIFFTISDESLLVKSGESKDFTAYSSVFVLGPRLINDTVNLGRKRHVAGITFRAGGLQRLMGIPMHELVNKDYDAALIFGNEIHDMQSRLKEARGNAGILTIIEHFLFKRLASLRPLTAFDFAINEMVKHNGNIPVETIAHQAGISIRQLERRSHDYLGMSPKLFARLTRFARAYALKENRPDFSWTDIAYELGYFDQTHLIKDFKAFAGFTPTLLDKQLTSSIKIITAIEGVKEDDVSPVHLD